MNRNRFLMKARRKIKQNGSLLLAIGAAAGFGTTIIFVARGQMKADAIIAERNKYFESGADPDEETRVAISAKEYFALTWQCYLPAAGAGLVTIACIIFSQYVSRKQMASALAALGVMTANRDQLEEAIRQKFGDETLAEIKKRLPVRGGVGNYISEEEVVEVNEDGEVVGEDLPDDLTKDEKEFIKYVRKTTVDTGKGDTLCCFTYLNKWFRSTPEAVEAAIEEFQDQIWDCNAGSLGDLLYLLGIDDEAIFSYKYGWYLTAYESNTEIDPDESEEIKEKMEPIKFDNSMKYNKLLKEKVYYIELGTDPDLGYWEY